MKKFLSLIALLAIFSVMGAKGLDPPRDHTTAGYEIVNPFPGETITAADVIFYEDVVVTDDVAWQPPGVLYERGITTLYCYPYTASDGQHCTAIIHNKDLLSQLLISDVYKPNRETAKHYYPEAMYWNQNLFRCDRAMYV